MTVQVTINGAAGRMGQRLVALALQDPDVTLDAAVDSPACSVIGSDAGAHAGLDACGIAITGHLPMSTDAIIDFSSEHGAQSAIDHCLDTGIGLVMATTGLTDVQKKQLDELSQKAPVVWAPNMSLAVNLTWRLAQLAAQTMNKTGEQVDVEIIERHHRFKKDSPSGTALKFGELIAAEMGQTTAAHGREGLVGERPANEIGYHAVRVGDDPGQHTIVFGAIGETVELRVAASDRDCYARGAIVAAKFLQGKSHGMYSMFDVLGI